MMSFLVWVSLLFNTKEWTFNGFLLLDLTFFYFLIILCFSTWVLSYMFVFLSNLFQLEKMFSFSFSFFIFLVSVGFLVCDLFYFLVTLEILTLVTILLIFYLSKDWDKLSSSFFLFVFNVLGSFPFIVFLSRVEWSQSPIFLFSLNSLEVSLFLSLCFGFILCSKLPIFVLHFWLTKAHVSASGCCSMVLASLLLKVGGIGLLKFCCLFSISEFLAFLVPFTIFMFLMFCLYMLRFFDLKHLIASSSVLHMSWLLPLIYTLGSVGFHSSVLMMSGHGIVSLYLFYLVSYFYEFFHNRSYDFSKSFSSYLPFLGGSLVFFFLLNLGLPPFINFLSEFYSLYFYFYYSLSVFSLLLASLVLSSFYFVFFLMKAHFGKKLNFVHGYESNLLIFFSFSCLLVLMVYPFMSF